MVLDFEKNFQLEFPATIGGGVLQAPARWLIPPDMIKITACQLLHLTCSTC